MDAEGLQRSFSQVAAYGDEVPLYFYSHLFLRHPQVRAMFPASMAAQRDRLVGALLRVVGNVHQLDLVVPYVRQLGVEHRKYGVLPEHYPLVGASLLATLAHFLGEEWTPELAVDWEAAYGVVADVMVTAAQEAAHATPPWFEAEVVGHEYRAPGIAVLTVRPAPQPVYRPGESLSVQSPLRPRLWRYYSPANAPRVDGTLEFHVRAVDGGWLSPVLVRDTGKGDVLRLGAAVGHGLAIPPGVTSSTPDVLMIAGGTGLAPLRSMVEGLSVQPSAPAVHLFVGARTPAELYDLTMLRELERMHPWLTVRPVVLGLGSAGRLPGGIVQGDVAAVATARRSWRDHPVYVCGSPAMVARSLEVLARCGVDPRTVGREVFSYDRHLGATSPLPGGALPPDPRQPEQYRADHQREDGLG